MPKTNAERQHRKLTYRCACLAVKAIHLELAVPIYCGALILWERRTNWEFFCQATSCKDLSQFQQAWKVESPRFSRKTYVRTTIFKSPRGMSYRASGFPAASSSKLGATILGTNEYLCTSMLRLLKEQGRRVKEDVLWRYTPDRCLKIAFLWTDLTLIRNSDTNSINIDLWLFQLRFHLSKFCS